MKVLFIGGPADGRRGDVDESYQWLQIPECPEPEFPNVAESGCSVEDRSFRVHTYYRQRIGTGPKVFIHEKLNPDAVIGMLVEGYRKPKD